MMSLDISIMNLILNGMMLSLFIIKCAYDWRENKNRRHSMTELDELVNLAKANSKYATETIDRVRQAIGEAKGDLKVAALVAAEKVVETATAVVQAREDGTVHILAGEEVTVKADDRKTSRAKLTDMAYPTSRTYPPQPS